jgi:hypothetical protein
MHSRKKTFVWCLAIFRVLPEGEIQESLAAAEGS